jgi:hypothetical protein
MKSRIPERPTVLAFATILASGGALLGARTARWGYHGHEIS